MMDAPIHNEIKMAVKRIIRLLRGLVRLLTFGHYRRNMDAWRDLVIAQSISQPMEFESGRFDDGLRDAYIREAAHCIDNALRTLYGERYIGRK